MLPDPVRSTRSMSSDEMLEQHDEPSTTMPERSTLSECAYLNSSVGRLLTWTCMMLLLVRRSGLVWIAHLNSVGSTTCSIGVQVRTAPTVGPLRIRGPRSHHALSVSPAAPDSSSGTYPGIILASDQKILPRWVHGVAWHGLWLEPGPLQGPGTGPVAEKDLARIIFIGSANGTGIGIGDRDRGKRTEIHTCTVVRSAGLQELGGVLREQMAVRASRVSRKSVSHRLVLAVVP
ncbi:hypothetical protein CGRA01v4_14648 [Colletotrichum graminicola]|nr:hypothetical protein CGRA01v4_14648 [Colletotrichum graminicola]